MEKLNLKIFFLSLHTKAKAYENPYETVIIIFILSGSFFVWIWRDKLLLRCLRQQGDPAQGDYHQVDNSRKGGDIPAGPSQAARGQQSPCQDSGSRGEKQNHHPRPQHRGFQERLRRSLLR